jgi:hypothetical protein
LIFQLTDTNSTSASTQWSPPLIRYGYTFTTETPFSDFVLKNIIRSIRRIATNTSFTTIIDPPGNNFSYPLKYVDLLSRKQLIFNDHFFYNTRYFGIFWFVRLRKISYKPKTNLNKVGKLCLLFAQQILLCRLSNLLLVFIIKFLHMIQSTLLSIIHYTNACILRILFDGFREVPTLARLYSDLGFTFKETLNSHIRSLGKDPQKLWSDIEDVIRQVFKLPLPSYFTSVKLIGILHD